MKVCNHEQFSAQVKVTCLTDTDGGLVTGHRADITINCHECGLPFRFIGTGVGVSNTHPTSNLDGLELRCPIVPHAPQGKAQT